MAVDLATKSLLHDKLRFLITVSGVAFAVTLVFVQVGLFLGLLDNASITIEHIDAKDLGIQSKVAGAGDHVLVAEVAANRVGRQQSRPMPI